MSLTPPVDELRPDILCARLSSEPDAEPDAADLSDEYVKIIVVGECGDGKSTLINNLCGQQPGQAAAATGKAARGVTKQITPYVTERRIQGKRVMLMDTPGVGDKDVNPMTLVAMIEERFASNSFNLQGVIVTSPVSDGRVKLGAQVVQALVDKGFVGGDAKWQNIVLTGTKKDRAEDDEEEFFRKDIRDEFFEYTDTPGPVALTSRNDCEELWSALERVADGSVEYSKPDSIEIASVIAGKCGIEEELFREKIAEERQLASQESQRMEDEFRRFLQEREQVQSGRRAWAACVVGGAVAGVALAAEAPVLLVAGGALVANGLDDRDRFGFEIGPFYCDGGCTLDFKPIMNRGCALCNLKLCLRCWSNHHCRWG